MCKAFTCQPLAASKAYCLVQVFDSNTSNIKLNISVTSIKTIGLRLLSKMDRMQIPEIGRERMNIDSTEKYKFKNIR